MFTDDAPGFGQYVRMVAAVEAAKSSIDLWANYMLDAQSHKLDDVTAL